MFSPHLSYYVRRFTLIPVVLIAVVGAVWASSLMIPDTAEFPSLPASPGTIGDVLKNKFRGDGTALNGQRFGGSGADQYLKGTSCATSDAVWKGIDASGNPICKGPPLAFAEIYEGTMQVNGTPQTVGYLLREGDKIETNTTQTGTIRFTHNPSSSTFAPGDSIARLGTGTTVLMDRGDTAGTLALITLQDGLLWGRVLTSTGINFGGGGVIAGVRGTSIALEKTGGQLRMVAPHSVRTGNTLTNAAVNLRTIYNDNTLSPLQFRRSIEFSSGAITGIGGLASTNRTLQQLYTTWQPTRMSPWIARNTVMDLGYMIGLNRPAGSTIDREIVATEPTKGTPDDPCRVNNTLWYDRNYRCVSGYTHDLTNTASGMDIQWSDGIWEALAVRDITNTEGVYVNGHHPTFLDGNWIGFGLGGIFNSTTSGAYKYTNLFDGILAVGYYAIPQRISHYNDWYGPRCIGLNDSTRPYCELVLSHHETSRSTPRNLYQAAWLRTNQAHTFYQDQTNNGASTEDWANSGYYSMVRFISGYQRDDSPSTGVKYTINTGTLNIDRAGEYLTYAGNGSQLQYYLTGGTVVSGLYNRLAGKTITIELGGAVPIDGNSKYLLDLGGVSYYIINSELRQRIGSTPTTIRTISTSDRVFEVTIPTGVTIDRFIIGNNSTNYATPINNRIQKIIIK